MAIRGRIALFVVALSVAAVGAASASATIAKLNITSIGNDQYTLSADVFNTDYYPYGVDVAFRLWGDDEWFDDLLYSPFGTTFGNGVGPAISCASSASPETRSTRTGARMRSTSTCGSTTTTPASSSRRSRRTGSMARGPDRRPDRRRHPKERTRHRTAFFNRERRDLNSEPPVRCCARK